MNFFTYLGIGQAEFQDKYIATRLIQWQDHDTFPLTIFTYGREAVHENVWDGVTRKCRGVIVNHETWEIIARPFEKFFNFGDIENGLDANGVEAFVDTCGQQPVVWEKMDGFLCTMYRWGGKNYVASKGSFTSPHAKWATAWLHTNVDDSVFPKGYTPVFEGICSSLRIVVDYGKKEELVMLALINNETGEEMKPPDMANYVIQAGLETPKIYEINWQEAHARSYDDTVKNEEGFVLTWYREGTTPFRLKVKYADYLRLHRMVTGVSPKRVLEVIQNGWTSELDEWTNDSNPWFNHFVAKWKRVIEGEYARIAHCAAVIYESTEGLRLLNTGFASLGEIRKLHAEVFNRPENKEFSGVLFAMLDGKDYKSVIWKKVRNAPIMKGGQPLVDAHNT